MQNHSYPARQITGFPSLQFPTYSTQAYLIHSLYCLNTVAVNAVVSVKLFGVSLADIELL